MNRREIVVGVAVAAAVAAMPAVAITKVSDEAPFPLPPYIGRQTFLMVASTGPFTRAGLNGSESALDRLMPEVHRKLEVTFSKAEIQAILAEKARALVLKRRDVNRVELKQVQHVEGEAVVTLVIGNKVVTDHTWPFKKKSAK
ncbi:MAG: hypothetical protein J0H40_17305 [Rhizobiales bacterium]|nr:hypothetical protein [Hyphomicrobiales bacterium]